jgi:hypothetical protein
MADFEEYQWDSGNGQFSNEANPSFPYAPGNYTPTLRAKVEGIWHEITKFSYIVVAETGQNLLDENYLNNPKSFHYGSSESQGFGWSENVGDDWIWPESGAAIFETDFNNEVVKIAYDLYDDKPYIINTREGNGLVASYLDKGTTAIPTEIVFPEYTGELRRYSFSHVETEIRFRAILLETSLPGTFEIDMGLITSSGNEPVEVLKDVDTEKEISFKFSSKRVTDTITRQIKVNTNESKYQLMGYNSTFKVNDKLKTASAGGTTDQSLYLSAPACWHTRGNYSLNLSTGVLIVSNGTLSTGPDSRDNSAYVLTADMILANIAQSDGCLMFWYTGMAPVITGVSYTDSEYAISGSWKLAYANGSIPANVTIPSLSEVFDIRIFSSNITTDFLDEYEINYENYLRSF